HDEAARELLDARGEARQRPGIGDLAIADRVEHLPAVVVAGIAMEQVGHHVGDVGTAVMGAVDVVVVDAVLGEAAREALAVARLGRQGEFVEQPGEIVLGHVRGSWLSGLTVGSAAIARNRRRSTLPVALRGKASTTRTSRGTL